MFEHFEGPPKRRGRWLRRLAWLVVGGFLFLEIGVNVVLATPLGDRLLNLQPEAVQMHYRSARMWYPFRVEVEGFELYNQDGNIQMKLTVDHAVATLHPLAALGIHILVTDVTGEGIEFRLRQRLAKAPSKAELDRLPPIDAFPDVLKPKVDIPPPFFPLVDLPEIVATGVRELWIDEYRYVGHIDVQGGFVLKPMEYLSLPWTSVTIDGGVVHFGEKNPLAVGPSSVAVHAEHVALPHIPREAWSTISARVDLEADVVSARWLNAYLSAIPDMRVLEGRGRLAVHAALDGGVIAPDSRFTLVTSEAIVDVPHASVRGKADIKGLVAHGKPELHIAMGNVRVERRDDQVPLVNSGQFTLVGRATSVDLAHPQDLHVELNLKNARAPSLTFLNRYIPASAGLSVYAGEGAVHGVASLGANSLKGKGELNVHADQLVLKNRSAMISGRAVIEGKFAEIDLRGGAVNLSGSRVALTNVGITTPAVTYRNFWLDVLASHAIRHHNGDWDATVAMKFANLQPVLGVMAANFALPQILVAFASIPDIYARGDLVVRADDIVLRQLLVEGKGLEARASLELKPVPPAGTLSPFGAALVKVPLLAVGLDLQGQRVVPVLAGADAWYSKTVPEEKP